MTPPQRLTLRRLVLATLAGLALLMAGAAGTSAAQETLNLAWDYDSPGTNITFRLYSGTTATPGAAGGGWSAITNLPCGATATNYQVTVTIEKPAGGASRFFAVTALAAARPGDPYPLESDFSNVVAVRTTPPGKNLTVKKN